jgi:phosphoglycerate dehydrogenase-like enzyme
MEISIHMLYPRYDGARLSELRAKLHPDIELTTGPGLPTPPEYQILIAGRPERQDLAASPNLRALVIPWAGVPESTRDLLLEFPQIAVHNLHHNSLPVAEHVVALLLAAAKFIVPMDRIMRKSDWTPRYESSRSVLLGGKTALILGYGAIGQKVARLCQGLGMEVIAVRRIGAGSAPQAAEGIRIAPLEALNRLLPRAHALLICLPHTPKTTGLIGANELALLPPEAVLVNVGRGPIVDEAALYHALRDGALHAAGLDVWYNYPTDTDSRSQTPPSDYAFQDLDNVVMSPHRAGASVGTEDLRIVHLAEMLNAAAMGKPMPNRVDLQAGY